MLKREARHSPKNSLGQKEPYRILVFAPDLRERVWVIALVVDDGAERKEAWKAAALGAPPPGARNGLVFSAVVPMKDSRALARPTRAG